MMAEALLPQLRSTSCKPRMRICSSGDVCVVQGSIFIVLTLPDAERHSQKFNCSRHWAVCHSNVNGSFCRMSGAAAVNVLAQFTLERALASKVGDQRCASRRLINRLVCDILVYNSMVLQLFWTMNILLSDCGIPTSAVASSVLTHKNIQRVKWHVVFATWPCAPF